MYIRNTSNLCACSRQVYDAKRQNALCGYLGAVRKDVLVVFL